MQISSSELATEWGTTRRNVNVALKKWDVKRDAMQRVNRDEVAALRQKYLDPVQQANGKKGGRPKKAAAKPAAGAPPEPPKTAGPKRGTAGVPNRDNGKRDDSGSINEGRRLEIWLKNKQRKLELERIEAKLVNRADVEAAAFERARAERDALLNLPARMAPIIAAEFGIDDRKLFLALEQHIRQFLAERSQQTALLNGNGSKAISGRVDGIG